MSKMASLMAAVTLACCAGGCAMAKAPVTGFVYLNTQANEAATSNDVGAKRGEACASSILGWVGTGDASVEAAVKAGGITKLSHVDSTASSILGIYAEYCTVAHGS